MRLANVFLCSLLLGSVCLGQGYMKALEDQINTGNSRKQPWTIVKESLDNSSNEKKYFGDYPTSAAAQKDADKLNKALKGNDYYKWNYKPWERGTGVDSSAFDPGSPGTGANPKAGPIKNPKVSTVDPGGSANSSSNKSPKSSLLGRRGRDKEPGDWESTIEISQTGKVTIASKLGNSYTAELKETPNGTPFFENSTSIFDVMINGAVVTVTRRGKKGFESINESVGAKHAEKWTFTLDGAPIEVQMEKGQAYNPPKDPKSSVLTRPIESAKNAGQAKYYIETLSYYTETKEAVGGGWIRQSKTHPETLEAAKANMEQQMAHPGSQENYRRTKTQWRIVSEDGTVVETASPFK
ncbi:hypothetical protein AYO47_01775 [Planctomyces sp. SCGC AG-212-M04]|nr:hypothetical protein AYO47_01775 [Planctomyces sp. SCGC AG-212-M04]